MARERIRLRLGTRSSALALAQSRATAAALEAAHPGVEVELVPIVTRGDTTPGSLLELGGKGLFTAELETGLLDGSLDLAVHSLKDLPVTLPAGLTIAAHPPREDPRDVLITAGATTLDELALGARVLTGSLRRGAQVSKRRPDLVVESIRGNVDTRIRKWRESGAAALVLAAAGLNRLGLDGAQLGAHALPGDVMVPAPGQGVLAVECRDGSPAADLCRALDDERTSHAARAERAVVAAFGGDCTLPLGAWARHEETVDGQEQVVLSVFLASRSTRRWVETTVRAATAEEAAIEAVERLRRDGADALLAEPGP